MFTADAHCDTLYQTVVLRAKERKVTPAALAAGDVGLQVFAMFAGDDRRPSFARGQAMLRAAREIGVPLLAGDLPVRPPQTPHAVLSVEGGEILEGSLDNLAALDDAVRLRMIALTWNFENEIGFPAVGGERRGLKPFGHTLLRAMNDRRILADVSHLNEAGFWEVCEASNLPVVASHSDCRWLCGAPRNLRREQARAIIGRDGFIGVNFYCGFLRERGRATIDDVVRHIDALMELGGERCVGFGSDFDGITAWPEGLETPADFPRVLAALEKRGYTPEQLAGIAGQNLYRTLRKTNRARE